MEFVLGDILSLKAAAIDPLKFDKNNPNNPNAILYWPGTQAKIVKINEDSIDLEFPSGEVVPHDPESILYFFNRIIDGKMISTKVTSHYGTPPSTIRAYMPTDTDWKRNYRYKITIETEDRGPKTQMCSTPECYNDLSHIKKDNDGLQLCDICGIRVSAINPQISK